LSFLSVSSLPPDAWHISCFSKCTFYVGTKLVPRKQMKYPLEWRSRSTSFNANHDLTSAKRRMYHIGESFICSLLSLEMNRIQSNKHPHISPLPVVHNFQIVPFPGQHKLRIFRLYRAALPTYNNTPT
jgi:hypothetical protein